MDYFNDLLYGFSMLLVVITVFGNLGIIILFLSYRDIRVVRNYIIFSLAWADLIIGLFAIPFAAKQNHTGAWNFSNQFCFAHVTIDVICTIVSILTVTLTALLDIGLVYGNLKTQINKVYSKGRVRILILISWWLPLLSVSLPIAVRSDILNLFVETAYNEVLTYRPEVNDSQQQKLEQLLLLNLQATGNSTGTPLNKSRHEWNDTTRNDLIYVNGTDNPIFIVKRCLPNFPMVMYINLVVFYYVVGMICIACSYSAIYIRIKRRKKYLMASSFPPTSSISGVGRKGGENTNNNNYSSITSGYPLVKIERKNKINLRRWNNIVRPTSKNPRENVSHLKLRSFGSEDFNLTNRPPGGLQAYHKNALNGKPSLAKRNNSSNENSTTPKRFWSKSKIKTSIGGLTPSSVLTVPTDATFVKTQRWRKNMRLLKMTFTLGIVATICYVPGCIVFLLDGIKSILIPLWVYNFAIWFSYAKSGINPVIYGFLNTKFRHHIYRLGKHLIWMARFKRKTTNAGGRSLTQSSISIITK